MKIYGFSGFGADERIFRKLDLKEHELVFVDWIEPQAKESLQHYALRMAKAIDTTNDFAILGISFGGMIATEIAKASKPKHTILLSTVMVKVEKPALYKMAEMLSLQHLIPYRFLKKYHRIDRYFFGLQHRSDIQLFKRVLLDTDLELLKWGMKAILTWKNTERIHCLRIHGTKDRVIPINKHLKADVVLNGGHLLPLTHPKEIEQAILQELSF